MSSDPDLDRSEAELVAAWQDEQAKKDFVPTHYVLVNGRGFDMAPDEAWAVKLAQALVKASDAAVYEGQKSPVTTIAVVKIVRQWQLNAAGELVENANGP